MIWLTPVSPEAPDPQTQRRSQLLIAASAGIIIFAIFFLVIGLATSGLTAIGWIFIAGCILLIVNPLLQQRWPNSRLPGTLFILELVLILGLLAFLNDGPRAAVLIWTLPIPLLANQLVGRWLGLTSAGLIVIQLFGLLLLEQSSYGSRT